MVITDLPAIPENTEDVSCEFKNVRTPRNRGITEQFEVRTYDSGKELVMGRSYLSADSIAYLNFTSTAQSVLTPEEVIVYRCTFSDP